MAASLRGWVIVSLLLASQALAGNDLLSQPQTLTMGERVAYYLQSTMVSASAILEARNSGDLLTPGDLFKVSVTYDPERKVIEVSMVGNQRDPGKVEERLGLTLKVLMGLNKKLQRNFGLTLSPQDISMDYLDAQTGRIILRYREGEYTPPGIPPPQGTPGPTPVEGAVRP